MKRYMALLICIFMLVSMMPAVALAEGGTTPDDSVTTPTDAVLEYPVIAEGSADGEGEYAAGVSVTIKAKEPEEGKRFKEWEGAEGLNFTSGDKTTPTVTFIMPAHSVNLKAVYEDIPAVTLQSIAITKVPAKTVYTVGDVFNPAGMIITATYSDNSSKEVTTGFSYPTGALTAGTTSVTISYTEGEVTKTTEQTITVNPAPAATKPTFTISHSKIVYGKTLTIKIEIDGAMARAASIGTLKLRVNGKDIESAEVNELPFELKIPANRNHGFKVGSNTVEIIFTGVDGVLVSSGEKKVTVTNDCNTMHYCCGEDHYNGKCVTVRAGEDVTFKVDLRCDETCQWYVDKGDGYGFTKISGATCASLTIKDVTRQQDGYRYRCVIKNCCETVGKPIFTLNVASGQLYTPKTGDSSAITIAAGCAALAAMMLVANRREKRAK